MNKSRLTLSYRIASSFVAFAFIFSIVLPPGYAQLIPQTLLNLPAPGAMVPASAAFMPTLIKGLTIHPENPLEFDFIVQKGDKALGGEELQKESMRLVKYFLASLTVPEEQMWVNLSPYEAKRIIGQDFGATEMGRDMLAQDYILKQLTASLMYPENEPGKKFWDRVYKKAYEKYGTTEIPMNTFNKVWIVPAQATVYEHEGSVFVVESRLKVMLEEDYVALESHRIDDLKGADPKAISGISSEIVREVLIPEIEKEVNEGENFANLRQIYNSMILATWYKKNLRQSLLGQVYVDKAKTKGVDLKDPQVNQKIYEQYIAAFKKGVYNYIREDYDETTKEVVPRKYFSGGAVGLKESNLTTLYSLPPAQQKEIVAAFRDIGNTEGDRFKNLKIKLYEIAEDSGISEEMIEQIAQDIENISADEAKDLFVDASSPILAAVNEIAQREVPVILQKMREVYGLTKPEVEKLTGNPFAQIGFDGTANRMGWNLDYLNWILQNPDSLEQTLADAQDLRENYENHIFIGMGGSGLGVDVIKSTFGKGKGPRIYSMRTTDPAVVDEITKQLADSAGGDLKDALRKTKIIVISKTFTTPEVLENRKYFEGLYRDLGIENVSSHFMLVTDPDSKLDVAAAQAEGYQVRNIQLNKGTDIGGRNTTFTNINLLPLAIVAPEKIMPFLQEAKKMNEKSRVSEDVFAILGIYLHYMATGYSQRKDKITFIVPEALRTLPMWSEQLIEESLGKDGKGITVVYGENLTAEKLQNPNFIKDRIFLRFNLAGQLTRSDLAEVLSGREDVFDINVESVDQIGGLMLGLQRTVAIIAQRWNINFVNQPGVEGYKRETREVLAKFKEGQSVEVPAHWEFGTFGKLKVYYTPFIEAGIVTKDELNQEVTRLGSNLSDGAAVYTALINIAGKTGKFELAEIASYGHMSPAVWNVMQKARTDIFTDTLEMASKLGEGPDRNHSFHQSVEQGPDYHLSTYLMPLETSQPQVRKYDENPLRAQTIGTVQSLIKAKRKAILIGIDGKIADSELVLGNFFEKVNNLLTSSSPVDIETKALEPSRPSSFGTSGDRGIIGKDFAFPLIRKLAQGTALYAKESYVPGQATLIGRDTRKMNDEFQKATAAIHAANGIPVIVIEDEPIPTPVLAFLAGRNDNIGGVINLTASHSPYTDGGFKFSPGHGGAADQKTTDRIQELSNTATNYQTLDYEEAKKEGLIKVLTAKEAVDQYVHEYVMPVLRETGALNDIVNYIKTNPDFELVLDPMQGTGVRVMQTLYEAIAQEVGRKFFIIINENNKDTEFKDVNGAPQPDKSTSNGKLIQKVKEKRGRMGLSIDGDVDRFGTVDFNGEFFGANDLIALLAFFLKQDIGLDGAIGKTVATSDFVNAVADYLQAELDEEKVGFKHFVRNMINGRKYLVAGEESAHVTVGPFTKTFDDGFTVGLTALWMVAKSNMSLADYKDKVEAAIQKRFFAKPGTIRRADIDAKQGTINIVREVNAELAQGKPAAELTFAQNIGKKTGLRPESVLTKDGVKLFFDGGKASVLLRPSGTEPAGKLYTFMAFAYGARPDPEKLNRLYSAVQEILFEASPAASSPIVFDTLRDDEDSSLSPLQSSSPIVDSLPGAYEKFARGRLSKDFTDKLDQKGVENLAGLIQTYHVSDGYQKSPSQQLLISTMSLLDRPAVSEDQRVKSINAFSEFLGEYQQTFNSGLDNLSSSPVNGGLLGGIPEAMKELADRDLRGIPVAVRGNLNVPINDKGEIEDAARLKELFPLLDFLIAKGANIILLGHHGRDKDRRSLEPVWKFFQNKYASRVPVLFHKDSVTENGLQIGSKDLQMEGQAGSFHLIENVRFALDYEQGPEGSPQREAFGQQLANLAKSGIFIFEGYGDLGSEGASVQDLPRHFIETGGEIFVGPSTVREAESLDPVVKGGIHVILFGGVKPDKVDPLAAIARKTLAKNGVILLGSSSSRALDQKNELLKKLFDENPGRVLSAKDYANDPVTRAPTTFDIGDETIAAYLEKLDLLTAGQTVLVNGTMGWIEGGYTRGTEKILKKLKELAGRGVRIVIIGGDGSASARKYELEDQPNVYIFTGGGVPLKILAGKKLKGVTALQEAYASTSKSAYKKKTALLKLITIKAKFRGFKNELARVRYQEAVSRLEAFKGSFLDAIADIDLKLGQSQSIERKEIVNKFVSDLLEGRKFLAGEDVDVLSPEGEIVAKIDRKIAEELNYSFAPASSPVSFKEIVALGKEMRISGKTSLSAVTNFLSYPEMLDSTTRVSDLIKVMELDFKGDAGKTVATAFNDFFNTNGHSIHGFKEGMNLQQLYDLLLAQPRNAALNTSPLALNDSLDFMEYLRTGFDSASSPVTLKDIRNELVNLAKDPQWNNIADILNALVVTIDTAIEKNQGLTFETLKDYRDQLRAVLGEDTKQLEEIYLNLNNLKIERRGKEKLVKAVRSLQDDAATAKEIYLERWIQDEVAGFEAMSDNRRITFKLLADYLEDMKRLSDPIMMPREPGKKFYDKIEGAISQITFDRPVAFKEIVALGKEMRTSGKTSLSAVSNFLFDPQMIGMTTITKVSDLIYVLGLDFKGDAGKAVAKAFNDFFNTNDHNIHGFEEGMNLQQLYSLLLTQPRNAALNTSLLVLNDSFDFMKYLKAGFGSVSSSAIEAKKGGIDLNPALLDLQIKRDGNGVPLPLPQQPIGEMRIDGFIPVIINITPVANLPLLLGLADTQEDADEAGPAFKAREPEEISALN